MKVIYHINSLYNPGGMERVVLNKATWLDAHGYEVCIVTTDQDGRPTFYDFPKNIRIVDLGINYSADNGKNIIAHIFSYLKKKRLHKKRLREVLMKEKADIVDTLYPGESSFIPSIKDGSKKIIELHQNRFFHRQYANKGLKGLIDRWRERQDVKMVSRFDKFVVLTKEDLGFWGNLPNIRVIPNAAIVPNGYICDSSTKRVIAVGRLDYQKSFDRLIKIWDLVCKQTTDWILNIYGQGEWQNMLQRMISERNLSDRCHLKGTTNNIWKEYATSSIIAMTSHYEGLPMVMIEAMTCGLPAVAFDFRCGPKDIIQQGINGTYVEDGDIKAFANSMIELMRDEEKRKRMSEEAKKISLAYSEERIMKMWVDLFEEITE